MQAQACTLVLGVAFLMLAVLSGVGPVTCFWHWAVACPTQQTGLYAVPKLALQQPVANCVISVDVRAWRYDLDDVRKLLDV